MDKIYYSKHRIGGKTITKQMSSWNETYGPVPKGFQASIKVSGYCEKLISTSVEEKNPLS